MLTASPNGNCTLRVGDAPSESKMRTLRPLDGTADEFNKFKCGRAESNFEGKVVHLPRDLECDACVLEIVFESEAGK